MIIIGQLDDWEASPSELLRSRRKEGKKVERKEGVGKRKKKRRQGRKEGTGEEREEGRT